MKKIVIIAVLFIVVSAAVNVQAASVTFEPQDVVLQVAPGKSGRTHIAVHGYSNNAYTLYFLVGTIQTNSNIPRGWLTAAYLWLDSKPDGTSSNVMNLIVEVPPDAKPGTYSALLEPDDMRSSEAIDSRGVNVTIEVPGPKEKELKSVAQYELNHTGVEKN